MTGERELPVGGEDAAAAEEEDATSASETERGGGVVAAGVMKPTWRTLGSLTVRLGLLGSMGSPATSSGGGAMLNLLGFSRSSGNAATD